MKTLYFHIGIAKTGSTFLQREIFPHLSFVNYTHKPKSNLVVSNNPYDGILNRFFQSATTVWYDLGSELLDEIFGATEPVDDGRDTLTSDENVCDHAGPTLAAMHINEFADLLGKAGFDQVRILCSVRQQATRFASGYAQVSDRCLGASQADFESDVRVKIGVGYHKHGIKFDYDLLRRKLVEVVGAENLLMLPYELMKEDPGDFLGQWFQFMERSVEYKQSIKSLVRKFDKPRNARSSSERTWMLREPTMRGVKTLRLRPGRLFHAVGLPMEIPLRFPDLEREKEIRITPQLEQDITRTYEESNKALSDAIGIDLSTYGYYSP